MAEYVNIIKNDPYTQDGVVYATLNNIPVSGTLVMVDILNLIDPTDSVNSDGTTVDSSLYEATAGERVVYFSGVPMSGWEGTYIAQYDYLVANDPKYLGQKEFTHGGLGVNGFPNINSDFFDV